MNFRITGEDTAQVLNIIKVGDILLRSNKKLVRLFHEYDEAAIYIGNGTVLTIKEDSVHDINIISFMRCHKIIVLRLANDLKNRAEVRERANDRAHQFLTISKNFDMSFVTKKLKSFELVFNCYREMMFPRFFSIRDGFYAVTDLSLINNTSFETIYKK